jgi:three-Cys-motif partner protein
MPYKDLHSDAFDETTITKLEIFEDYTEAWIPTFLFNKKITRVQIFDFFSGPGFDRVEVPGSPIRLLLKIKSFISRIKGTNTKVHLYFNEYEPGKSKQLKFELLNKNIEQFLDDYPELKEIVVINYYNEDAETLFYKLLPEIKKAPSLVFLDQNGVRFISPQFLKELEQLNVVDFIYFVSSSYFWRFGNTEEFRKVFDINMEELKRIKYQNVHRFVISEVKKRLPDKTKLKLFPFSLKKGTNIYGIIFGAKHFLAVDKFLEIAWKKNATNGEADFDIDEDAKKIQIDLFGNKQMTKVEKFSQELEELILFEKLRTNEEVLIHSYESGHIPAHANVVLRKLKREGKIVYDGLTPGISYENVFRRKMVVNYKKQR